MPGKERRSVSLAVFLGNPGRDYRSTRHNLGFRLGELAAEKMSPGAGPWRDWRGLGLYLEIRRNGQKLYFLKPATFMNASGEAARDFAGFYKIPPGEALAVYDDLSLPFGRLRVRLGGSSGGHRGIASLISSLGTQDVPRLRLGIGPRPAQVDAKDFVLGNFTQKECALGAFLDRGLDALLSIIDDGPDSAMNLYNNGETDRPE